MQGLYPLCILPRRIKYAVKSRFINNFLDSIVGPLLFYSNTIKNNYNHKKKGIVPKWRVRSCSTPIFIIIFPDVENGADLPLMY